MLIYTDFIDSTKEKVYTTRVVNAIPDSNTFITKVEAVIGDRDAEHPILELLVALSSDLKLDLYIALGKKRKALEKEEKSKSKGVSKEKSGEKRLAPSEVAGSSQSQQSDRDQRRAKRARFAQASERIAEEDKSTDSGNEDLDS
jgi:hypothetical protein